MLLFTLELSYSLSTSRYYCQNYSNEALLIIVIQLSSLLLGITDPFVPFENLFCAICMGGVFDVIQETFYGKPAAEENGEAVKPKAGKLMLHCQSFHKCFKLFCRIIFHNERQKTLKLENYLPS